MGDGLSNEMTTKDEEINNRLREAVEQREVSEVEGLLKAGATLHKQDDSLALHCLAKQNYDVLSELLAMGANPSGNGGALLLFALKEDDIKGFKLLVDAGADIMNSDADLMTACRRYSSVKCWRFMYKQGVEPSLMGWRYFAGIMGPPELVKRRLEKNDSAVFKENIRRYEQVMANPID